MPSANGTWKSIGSGWILNIKDSTEYAFYDITSISCIPSRKGNFKEIESSLQIHDDTLSLQKGIISYKFIKHEELPQLCETELTETRKNDPVYNFEVFAETVKEHYAFFDLNQIDWNSLYNTQRAKINVNTSDVELFQLIDHTFEQLNDNHAYLEATDDLYEALDSLQTDLAEDNLVEENTEELPEYGDFTVAEIVAKNHLEEEMTTDSWLMQWGKLNDKIGYVQIKAMWLYADLNIPEDLIQEIGYVDAYVETFHQLYEGEYMHKEVLGVRKTMKKILQDLSNMESIVLDVRFNGGGQDAVSYEILSWFLPRQKLQVATEKLRYGTSYSPTQSIIIEAKDNAFTKNVYVLTSQQSASAAESFAIATMAMSNVKRIGMPTDGAISTALEKKLPNGWAIALSNELFMDNNGKTYENLGVPVDFELGYAEDRQTFFRSVVNDLEADKQTILKAVNAIQ
ncbi:peptidase [Muricauda sp. NBRC 101325]|nr:peptidase [Muricauda sp. NBRC 101325]